MPTHILQRPATPDEQALLAQMLASRLSPAQLQRKRLQEALVLWAISLFALLVIWQLLAWLARKLLAAELGWHSAASPWLLMLCFVLATVVAVRSVFRAAPLAADQGPTMQQDLDAGMVQDEYYEFTELLCFQEQEQEHGGLLYFLRTKQDKVLALFDAESQELGTQGKDPLASRFQPKSQLQIVRTPQSGMVLSLLFAGKLLPRGEVQDLLAPPDAWPEPDAYCDCDWADLAKRYGRA